MEFLWVENEARADCCSAMMRATCMSTWDLIEAAVVWAKDVTWLCVVRTEGLSAVACPYAMSLGAGGCPDGCECCWSGVAVDTLGGGVVGTDEPEWNVARFGRGNGARL